MDFLAATKVGKFPCRQAEWQWHVLLSFFYVSLSFSWVIHFSIAFICYRNIGTGFVLVASVAFGGCPASGVMLGVGLPYICLSFALFVLQTITFVRSQFNISILTLTRLFFNKEKKVAEGDLPRLAGHPKDGGETGSAIHYSSDFQFSGYIIISALRNTAIYTDI
jgi:hypothetical protein